MGEHNQDRSCEGSVEYVDVFRMVSLGASILGRPRPRSRDRHAGALAALSCPLICEEP